MLKTRVITAIILLAVFLPVTLFAPVGAFGALIAFVVVFAAWEWARLLKLGGACVDDLDSNRQVCCSENALKVSLQMPVPSCSS